MKYIDNWYGIQLIANKFIRFCVINIELYAKRCSGWLYSPSVINYRFFVKNKERNFTFALLLKKWRKVTRARTEPLLSKDVANHAIQSILSDMFILNFVLVLVLSSNFFLRLIFIYQDRSSEDVINSVEFIAASIFLRAAAGSCCVRKHFVWNAVIIKCFAIFTNIQTQRDF